jgi:hypothetical protein
MDRVALTALYLDEIRQRGLRASDLLGDLPGLKPFEYQGRYLSRPLFIGYPECRQLYADVENVRTALLSLPGRLYGGDFAAFGHAAGAYGPVAAVLTSQNKPTQLARADLFASQAGFQLLELNHSSAIGGADNVDMCRALLRHPVLAEFARAHGLGYVDTVRHHVDTLFAETGLEPGSCPIVALTDWPTRYGQIPDPYLAAIAADWQQRGVDTHACHLGELSRRRGRVWLGDRPVDVIFRVFSIGRLLESSQAPAMLAPVLDAVARGEVKLCAPLDSDIFSSKAALAMISSSRAWERRATGNTRLAGSQPPAMACAYRQRLRPLVGHPEASPARAGALSRRGRRAGPVEPGLGPVHRLARLRRNVRPGRHRPRRGHHQPRPWRIQRLLPIGRPIRRLISATRLRLRSWPAGCQGSCCLRVLRRVRRGASAGAAGWAARRPSGR